MNSLDLDDFIKNSDILPCQCQDSPFSDKHHKHIVTGDLRLINNHTLRKIFSKGPKYRESRTIDLHKAKTCVLKGLEECVNGFCNKHGIHKSYFNEWISNIKIKINSRIDVLKETLHIYQQENSLSSPDVINALEYPFTVCSGTSR